MGRLDIVPVRQFLDFLGRQGGEKSLGKRAKQSVAQTIDALEMLEKENQPLQVGSLKLAINAVERVRHRMADRRFLEITLKVVNVLAQRHDFGMLRFRNAPDEQMKFT